LFTEFVRWQNDTRWLPGPSVVAGLAGVVAAVVVSAAAVVDVVVDGSVEVVVGVVVVCAPALIPPSTKTKNAPVAIPTTVARRTRALYGDTTNCEGSVAFSARRLNWLVR
jgi:hypothetical protein